MVDQKERKRLRLAFSGLFSTWHLFPVDDAFRSNNNTSLKEPYKINGQSIQNTVC